MYLICKNSTTLLWYKILNEEAVPHQWTESEISLLDKKETQRTYQTIELIAWCLDSTMLRLIYTMLRYRNSKCIPVHLFWYIFVCKKPVILTRKTECIGWVISLLSHWLKLECIKLKTRIPVAVLASIWFDTWNSDIDF